MVKIEYHRDGGNYPPLAANKGVFVHRKLSARLAVPESFQL